MHTKVLICKDSELPAGEYCPETSKEEKVYLLKEEKYSTKTWDTEYILPKKFKKKTCDKHTKETWLLEQQKKEEEKNNATTEQGADTTTATPNP